MTTSKKRLTTSVPAATATAPVSTYPKEHDNLTVAPLWTEQSSTRDDNNYWKEGSAEDSAMRKQTRIAKKALTNESSSSAAGVGKSPRT